MKELHDIFLKSSGVTTDSRAIHGGELFFALKGENFDGNDYAVKALQAGAAYAVISADRAEAVMAQAAEADAQQPATDAASQPAAAQPLKSRLIPVPDTLQALQALARYHRSVTFVNGKPLTVIGLTGTNGKTTTKELIKAVLSVKYRVTATEGNLNNSIGVPLTLLKINGETEIAVVEMGASHPGDIKELCSVCLPNYGLITNVGKAHLLGFGSLEGVMRAKGELYDYIQRTADRVFLNVDNPLLCTMASQRPDLVRIPYGLSYSGAEILPVTASEPYLRLRLPSGRTISTLLIGSYNADNVMAALAVAAEFEIPEEDAATAIESYHPGNHRSQFTDTGKNHLILDAYNANPTSMEAALNNFECVQTDHKAVMLGNMLELGHDSVAEHVKILEKLSAMHLDRVYLVGEEFRKAMASAAAPDTASADSGSPAHASAHALRACAAAFNWYADSEELASALSAEPLRGMTVLIKGSRGSRMEKVLPEL